MILAPFVVIGDDQIHLFTLQERYRSLAVRRLENGVRVKHQYLAEQGEVDGVVVDAADLQVASVEARLVSPVKVGLGLAANVRSATISYRAQRLSENAWLPCVVALRVTGRTGLVFRLDSEFRFEFSGYARYLVEVETEVGSKRVPSVQSEP